MSEDTVVTNPENVVKAPPVTETAVLNVPNPADNPAVKTDGDQPKGEDGKKTDKPADGAPEKYEDFTLPEGMEADVEVSNKFKDWAKQHNLSQAAAQELVNFQTDVMKRVSEAQQKGWESLKETWVNDAKSDQEYGGSKFNESLAIAKVAMDALATPEFKEMLDVTGTGNHPEMIRFMYRVGKAMSEDKLRVGNSPSPVKSAKDFYDKSNMN